MAHKPNDRHYTQMPSAQMAERLRRALRHDADTWEGFEAEIVRVVCDLLREHGESCRLEGARRGNLGIAGRAGVSALKWWPRCLDAVIDSLPGEEHSDAARFAYLRCAVETMALVAYWQLRDGSFQPPSPSTLLLSVRDRAAREGGS